MCKRAADIAATTLLTASLVLFPPYVKSQTFTTLHSFEQTDGASPQGALVLDATGAIYGTTVAAGGTFGNGSVFRLDPDGKGRRVQ